MQIDIEGEKEDSKQQGIPALGKWPWNYPKYDTSKSTLRKWERTRKFHDMMWGYAKDLRRQNMAIIWGKINRLYLPVSI